MNLSGWGRFPVHTTQLSNPRTLKVLGDHLKAGGVIARGNGRAYGDSAVAVRQTLQMARFDHFLSFNSETGQLVAEAGVLLKDIITSFLPRGWFPSVTPGTKFVTLGGMIAADVHGKNHHKDSSFCTFLDWVDLLDVDGNVQRCSLQENSETFAWTIGGMGLTGIILRAAIRLRPVESAWIRQTTRPRPNLDATIEAFETSEEATYSVAWIDCLSRGNALGRSLLMLGEHATQAELSGDQARYPFEIPARRSLRVPFCPPKEMLNRWTVRAFNGLYYWSGNRKAETSFVDYDSYFYPLDKILGWNRIYGRQGFIQFQCALPLESSRAGLKTLLEATSAAGAGSFLAVLKRFGAQESLFSFPMLGYTLALDFPATPEILKLMDLLDQITLDHGGRFYLAKDSRMTAAVLQKSDDRVSSFKTMRKQSGLSEVFQSKQSERLSL